MVNFDIHTVWEIQALNSSIIPDNTWVKLTAKQQKELFGYNVVGRKDIKLDVLTNTISICKKIAFGGDIVDACFTAKQFALILNSKTKIEL